MLETESNSKLELGSDLKLDLASDSMLESVSESELELASDSEIESGNNTTQNYDIVLQVKPQKVTQIKSQIIDGKKYIVIPMDDDEQANVNGVNTLL